MRTPLASATFLLSFIIKFLMALNVTGKEGKDKAIALKYASLIRSTISLTQSFVNDLLDLR